ncbi:MAG TPA: ABC transporter permease [Actinomycetes bacterium]|jgi:ABC-2 type transport system permease protein/lipopolysaccharide transport system permease protein|nr:ABC transporter permease [Actinomycetes bacterium]
MSEASPRVAAAPPSDILFRLKVRLVPAIREVWRRRELVRTLAERDLRVRYKQAVLGFAWSLLTPLALMLVFTVFFQRVAKVDTGGAPYALFAYLGLLPWTFFSTSVNLGGQSLVTNNQLVNKVYCPREVFPLASVVVAATDTVMATLVLGLLFVITGFAPRATTVWVPLLLAVQVAFTFGVTLVMSAVLVFLRDLRHLLPIILQLGLFATPVAYGMNVVSPSLQILYCTLNPLAPVIDGYRRTILQGLPPDWHLLGPGAATAAVVLSVGYVVFKRLEPGFADYA